MGKCFRDGCRRDAGWQVVISLWPATPFGKTHATIELADPIYACDVDRKTITLAEVLTDDLWSKLEAVFRSFGKSCSLRRSEAAIEVRLRQRQ
jgi:hypothetical protein